MQRLAGFGMRSRPWEKEGRPSIEAQKRRPAEKPWRSEEEQMKDPEEKKKPSPAQVTAADLGGWGALGVPDDEMWNVYNNEYYFLTGVITKEKFTDLVIQANQDPNHLAALIFAIYGGSFKDIKDFIHSFTKESFNLPVEESYEKNVKMLAHKVVTNGLGWDHSSKVIQDLPDAWGTPYEAKQKHLDELKQSLEKNSAFLKGSKLTTSDGKPWLSTPFVLNLWYEYSRMEKKFHESDQTEITHREKPAQGGIEFIIPKHMKPFGKQIEKAGKFFLDRNTLERYDKIWAATAASASPNVIPIIKHLRAEWHVGLYVAKRTVEYMKRHIFKKAVPRKLEIPPTGPHHYITWEGSPPNEKQESLNVEVPVDFGDITKGVYVEIPWDALVEKKFFEMWKKALQGDSQAAGQFEGICSYLLRLRLWPTTS
jgi:hypothetical protein